MLCKNQVCWSTRHTWFAKIVPKETPNLNFHYKSTIFFSWEFIDVYTGSAELWDLNFAYDWSIEDHLFFPWIISKIFIKWLEVGSPFGLGAKKLIYQAQILFWKFNPKGKKSWEMSWQNLHETQALKQGRMGSNPGNQTSSTKIGGERYIGEIPLNCCKISDVRRFGKIVPGGTEIFAAFLTSFVSRHWSNSGGMASDR